jgi:hypothetical protein
MQGDGSDRGRMSEDVTAVGATLTPEELGALVDSIVNTRCSREQIRVALRPWCARARDDRMDVADFVKLVKQSFKRSSAALSLGHAGERQQTLDRIISVCIDEYYAAR